MSARTIACKPGSLARHETLSTREPAWVKGVLIGIALTFFAVFLLLPLATVFAEACARAGGLIAAALVNPMPGRRSS
jgi:sulfate transport system permease protein